MADINKLILQRIAELGDKKAAEYFGVKPTYIKMVKKTKKPSAAMMVKFMQDMDVETEESVGGVIGSTTPPFVPIEQPAPKKRARSPVPAQAARTPGVAPMFTAPSGEDRPMSAVRPAGGPMIVPPRTGPITRHPGMASTQGELITGNIEGAGTIEGPPCPPGVNQAMWQMFQMFVASMGGQMPGGMGVAGPNPSTAPVQGNLEMPETYGVNWNVPHGAERPQVARPRARAKRQPRK